MEASATAATDAPRRIRFLYSDTGGGHRASALALQDALEAAHPGRIECDIVDLFVESGRLPFCEYPQIYKKLAETPWQWKLLFDFGDWDFGILFNEWLTELICYREFRRLLAETPRPDLVISVHPLLQAVPLKALAELDGGTRTTPFCTVVTDLGSASRQWFDNRVDKCYVPSDALGRIATGRGLASNQIVQFGLPIRRGFWKGSGSGGNAEHNENDGAQQQRRLRTSLGLAPDRSTVLVVGGGDGMGGLSSTAVAIGDALGGVDAETQLVVVCGRNEQAAAELAERPWPTNVGATILGFVDNMEEYMGAASLLVTKAGPGTIAEATTMGLPCVLSSFLPGQEEGNVAFVESSGFGAYRSDNVALAELVVAYLKDDAQLRRLSDAARRASRPEATMAIAKDLAKLVGVE